MNRLNILLIGLIAVCSILSVADGRKIINCYYSTWAKYREGEGAFTVDNIDPFLCTHISYSFYGIDENSGEIKSLDRWLSDDSDFLQQVIKLKEINKKLKILLVVGGWMECITDKYSRMAASPTMRKNFVDSAKKIIKKHNFDGLDLDWEYPVTRNGSPADKKNFVTLLKETHKAMKSMGKEFGIAVAAGKGIASEAYDIPGIAKNVDFINVMTYDFASHYGAVVGFNAPLEGQGENNLKSAIKYWMDQGAPASKLVLGLPFYGHTFKLADPARYSIGAQVVGSLPEGPITKSMGTWGYNEICKIKNSYSYKWSKEHSVPFLHKGTDFISYDDVKSIELKVDFSNSLNLRGVMIWSIETDDFHGKCGDGKFPLLNAINKRIANSDYSTRMIRLAQEEDEEEEIESFELSDEAEYQPNVPRMITLAQEEDEEEEIESFELSDEAEYQPNVQNYQPDTPVAPPLPGGDCKDGIYPHPNDCTMFVHCANNVQYVKSCPASLHFDASINACNYPEQANCRLNY